MAFDYNNSLKNCFNQGQINSGSFNVGMYCCLSFSNCIMNKKYGVRWFGKMMSVSVVEINHQLDHKLNE